jgi:L-alanine-DL-glutamate epimerase-like enolase superfamily enzyme
MATFDRVAALPVRVDRYSLERLEHVVPGGFTRVSTVIRLEGGDHDGVGEDVTYDANDQDLHHEAGATLPLTGDHTLERFSDKLECHDLFPEEPQMAASRHYRRWAFESAALDLALRQAGASLADTLGIHPRPVRFVVSMRLGNPPDAEILDQLAELYPGLRFKLDPTSDWTDEFTRDLAAREIVDVVDLKGAYKGTPVDQPADPALYRRVIAGFPNAWIEDPDINDETRPLLELQAARITWDAPIHSVADIENAPYRLLMVNIKPSRFGRIRDLFDAYDYCATNKIGMYGGGQFELGPGRGQIQYLASLFHAANSNDVAPAGFNTHPGPGLPAPPLEPAPSPTGFRWET